MWRRLGRLLGGLRENNDQNPDFVTGTSVARIGIVENPEAFESTTVITEDRVSATYSLKLKGLAPNTNDYRSTTFLEN